MMATRIVIYSTKSLALLNLVVMLLTCSCQSMAVTTIPDEEKLCTDGIAMRTEPYTATKKRFDKIKSGYFRLEPHMTLDKIDSIIGKPDYIYGIPTAAIPPVSLGFVTEYIISIPNPHQGRYLNQYLECRFSPKGMLNHILVAGDWNNKYPPNSKWMLAPHDPYDSLSVTSFIPAKGTTPKGVFAEKKEIKKNHYVATKVRHDKVRDGYFTLAPYITLDESYTILGVPDNLTDISSSTMNSDDVSLVSEYILSTSTSSENSFSNKSLECIFSPYNKLIHIVVVGEWNNKQPPNSKWHAAPPNPYQFQNATHYIPYKSKRGHLLEVRSSTETPEGSKN